MTLAKRHEEETALAAPARMNVLSNPIQELIVQLGIEKAMKPESVAALKELSALSLRLDEVNAEKAFAAAFADLQAELPQVLVSKPIPDNTGKVRYYIAPYEDIMEQVGPLMTRHGFSISFSSDIREGPLRIAMECTLRHAGGHKSVSGQSVRIGRGPPGSSEAQADGAATTYARRYALCATLNIVIEHDTDARNEGGTITQEDAAALEKRTHDACRGDRAQIGRLLKLAGADRFCDIREKKCEMLVAEIERIERAAAPVKIEASNPNYALVDDTKPLPPIDADEWNQQIAEAAMDRDWKSTDLTPVLVKMAKSKGFESVIRIDDGFRRSFLRALKDGKLDKFRPLPA